ncbi:acyl-CoA thioesterase [Alteromonas sp. 5E99-2]|uniref:acyl-CoA thioesterase n=1 Tax=Alteromonas sp. 5E99-2 TaxID=2817683 RepID=UPI001A99F96C|nr:thioesterase family protein [Alteromonas sp. 5E99-2]MBO1255129.1 acyl-CoA thioesterase [Alteromonas sp. 5E99-2]
MTSFPWRYDNPFILEWQIQEEHIDHYGHANNVAYIAQLEKTAWAHSNNLGLTIEQYKALDRAMVVKSHNVDYLLPCNLNETLLCATWVVQCSKKIKLKRKFQYLCTQRKKIVFEAETLFVCIALSSGRPTRMPTIFEDVYGGACIGEVQ